jgi:hypothetical protein
MTVQIANEDWNQLSDADRDQIRKIIAENFDGETVEAVAGGVAVLSNPTCTAACNVAQEIAVAQCQRLPFPANIACSFAAQQAGNYCRSRC